MKMLILIGPEGRERDLRDLIARHSVHAYSEFRNVTGEGSTGRHLGTSVFPGRSAVIFTVVPAEKMVELKAALAEFRKTLYADEGLRAFVLPVEEML
ncbi:MAG: hypothetical protein BWK77_04555 [Verrucomicrobia bacterium A1]|nr:MAG: hypothetical protein BWK77_04555 [Verrucomicrobia bacterium A1]